MAQIIIDIPRAAVDILKETLPDHPMWKLFEKYAVHRPTSVTARISEGVAVNLKSDIEQLLKSVVGEMSKRRWLELVIERIEEATDDKCS